MLAIRLQRTGRSGHAMFRVIVQDSRKSPTSGKIVAYVGNYDPHTKNIFIDKEKTNQFLANGAQPSNRLIPLLKAEGIKLPKWVSLAPAKKKTTRNPEKRRSTAPPPSEKPAEEAKTEEVAPTETTETVSEKASTEEIKAEESTLVPSGQSETEPAEEAKASESQETTAEETKAKEPAESEEPGKED